jgi:hypothetical protein
VILSLREKMKVGRLPPDIRYYREFTMTLSGQDNLVCI